MKSVVTAGETDDSRKDGNLGWRGLAAQTASSERKNPKQATKPKEERYPQGCPRGGGNEHPSRTDLRMTTQDNGTTTTTVQCICGKSCKNERGLRIHQGRMRCLKAAVTTTQRTEVTTSGKTQEEPGLEATHSAQSLLVSPTSAASHSHAMLGCPQVTVPSDSSQSPQYQQAAATRTDCGPLAQPRIQWPQASKKAEWHQFDEDVNQILEVTGKGDVDHRLLTMTTLIVNFAAERFGTVTSKPTPLAYTQSHRVRKIKYLREELKLLKRQYKAAGEEERVGLVDLRGILRKQLLTLCRAESHRRRRKERARKRAAFLANPFKLTKQLLGHKRTGQLTCSKDAINNHLKATYSDPNRERLLGPCDALLIPPEPTSEFNLKEPCQSEVEEVVRRARSSSAPGPSGVPYKVYKNCPKLRHRLWKALKVIWRRGKIAQSWRYAEGVYIPKEEKSVNIDQFRVISLLSVESKIFFSIVAKRLSNFLLSNKYIDTSVQKGGIPGVPGCLEHTGVVTQLIREAREGRGDLAVLWLDLTNAYGSIPHKLVEVALEKHHVPQKVKGFILDYYSKFSLRVSSGQLTTDWHQLEVGIITGCTISVTLFALAMNMMVKAAETECRGPLSKSGVRQPPIRAFMDDITVTTTTVPGARWILQGLERLMVWARMSFKPGKSRSLVRKKGKVTDEFRFRLGQHQIPSVTEKPVKSLGKAFSCSLNDRDSIRESSTDMEGWLRAVDRSGLPGRFKAWVYQHGILPRLLWPLLIYEVPMTVVEGFEQKVSSYLRRWLGLPHSLSNTALYGKTNKLRLPFGSVREEFIVARAREHLMYSGSRDAKVSGAGIVVRTGRKWRAAEAVQQAETRLKHKAILGSVTQGRAGLGSLTANRYDLASGRERQRLVQEEVRASVEEERSSRAVAMRQQGAWMKWEQAMERNVTWKDIWTWNPQRIRFLIQGVYDILPSPSNLYTWGRVETPACPQCSTLRPDIILVSEATRQLILLELTVPWEERMEEAQERKRGKYQELVEQCRINGWRTRCMPVEVGSRGFASHTLSKAYGTLGITGVNRRRAISNNVEAVEKASRWLWLKRGERWGR
ncbi:reverse transcriptase [Labeo rohita]|uniref:Reverse transcriptase n=1 Tax=Labeo rohita TaxID=84645 RepID=A0A498LG40_LABRO|nr:reverse transcriptase [Labeo rohita]RXN06970.1 reverse transcriptase [Labeo rohita]